MNNDNVLNPQIKIVAGIVAPYSLLCAFLNLYYYWKPFGVQPFEFISISDALAYGIPYLMLSVFMLVPVFILEAFNPTKYPKGTEKGYASFLVALVIILNFVVIILAEIKEITLIPIYIGLICGILPLAIRLATLKEFSKIFPSRTVRAFLFLIICCLPSVSVTHAVMKRSGVIERSSYMVISGVDIKAETEKGELAYIGCLGDYIFLQRENSTVAYRLEDLMKLELKKGKPIAHNKALNHDTQ